MALSVVEVDLWGASSGESRRGGALRPGDNVTCDSYHATDNTLSILYIVGIFYTLDNSSVSRGNLNCAGIATETWRTKVTCLKQRDLFG